MDEGEQAGDEGAPDGYTVDFQQHYDWTETAPSLAVVTALAELEETDSTEMHLDQNLTLYDWISPEALDTLLQENHETVSNLTFEIFDYQVQFETTSLTVYAPEQ